MQQNISRIISECLRLSVSEKKGERKVDIRILNREDAQEVEALEREAFPDPWSLKSIEDTLEQKNYMNLGVWREGELLGYLFFSV